MRTLVIYHGGGCFDGFCAAWVLRKLYPDAEFHPAKYGEPPPDCTGKRVVIADFSYRRPVMLDIVRQAGVVAVLDHHRTAEQELAGLSEECYRAGFTPPSVVFDMEKSGARLAWEYVCRHLPGLNPMPPWLVDYTQDRDLWRWKLPRSREINAALRTFPMEFGEWDSLAGMPAYSAAWGSFIDQGAAVLRAEKQVVDQHVRNAKDREIGGYTVPAVNATVLFSEIAGELAQGRPFGACYFDRADGRRQWSLRSRDGGVDVSEVAKRFGGGGHRNAAGFEEPVPARCGRRHLTRRSP